VRKERRSAGGRGPGRALAAVEAALEEAESISLLDDDSLRDSVCLTIDSPVMPTYPWASGGKGMSHQLTIRYDDAVAREIEELARRERISRNQAAVRLLRMGARLDEPDPAPDAIGDSLDWFIGSWTDEQARELEDAITDFERVDENLWR
jgi:hypothetical protein